MKDKLRRQLALSGLNIKEIADCIGSPPRYVYNWFRSDRDSIPDSRKLYLLSKIFGVTMEYWLEDIMEEELITTLMTLKEIRSRKK